MKNTLLFATLLMLIFSISSCNLDILPETPKSIDPILLEDRYDEDITLSNHNEDGIDYIVTEEVDIYDGIMTIEPGVTIQFEENTSFNVGIEGRLDAVGNAGEPIRMIAKENNPSWSGIYIGTIKSNKIHHVQIENAGSGTKYGVYNKNAAAITIDGKVSIENSTISKSGDVGVKLNGNNSTVTSFSGNTIKDCEGFPILSNILYLKDLDLSNNIFSGNGTNMIGVEDVYNDRLSVETELDGLEIPYFFSGEFEIYEDLILNRGVEIIMDNNSLLVHSVHDFRLQVKGTQSDHVVVRGAESENGYWQGILVTSANNGNVFDYLDISDGGGQKLTWGEGKANISMEGSGNLELNNCTSARSGECELFLSSFGSSNQSLTNNSPAITKVCME